MKAPEKFLLALVAALALLLAGCGGGNNNDDDEMEMTPPTAATLAAERKTITDAVSAAETAVNAVGNDSADAVVTAADSALAAITAAINNADNLAAGDRTVVVAQGQHQLLTRQLNQAKTARTMAMASAMTATGKALYAALAGPDPADSNPLGNATGETLSAAGLVIDVVQDAGALPAGDNPVPVTLKAGDDVTALMGWSGKDYKLEQGTGSAKRTTEARIYHNQEAAEQKPFSGTGGVYTLVSGQTGAGAANNGYLGSNGTTTPLDVSSVATDLAKVMADAFLHSGTQTHQVPERSNALYVRGTYDGAPGEFRCMMGPCSSTNDGSGAPSALGGTWHFKPDAGAMVSIADTHYLYYGWWVSKDKDGNPTAASAFTGRMGVDSTDDNLDLGWTGTSNLTGSATYAGHAAGKYAINNVLGLSHGGHFTADAMLTAKFNGTDSGVTGTIDNFRLNDGSEDPGWSVALARGGFGANGQIMAPSTAPTVWSMNDNKASPSGTWSGMMYDEAVHGDDNDGSNIPTTVTGTFYSEFGSIGRMVGAFGAEKAD